MRSGGRRSAKPKVQASGSHRYCSWCGGALEERLVPQEGHLRLVCSRCGRIHYLNPKPTASVLIERQNRVLLVRRAEEPCLGLWDAPGGFLELDEEVEAGARREVREELGVELGPLKLLGVFSDDYGSTGLHTLNVYYTASIASGRLRAASDVSEWRWFGPAELPAEGEIAFQNVRSALGRWRRGLQSH